MSYEGDTMKFAAEVDRKEISHESWERSRSRITARPSQRITRRSSGRGAGGGRYFQSQTDVLGLLTWSSPA